jgi:hypothetical protein
LIFPAVRRGFEQTQSFYNRSIVMKLKGLTIAVVMLLIAGAAFAQNADWGQTVTVDGTLQLQNGRIVLVSGDKSYFVPGILRYVGFIDGLKEGAEVSVQGYTDGYRLMPTSFTVNGKSYDLTGRFNNPEGGWTGPGSRGPGSYGEHCGGYRAGHCGGWDDDDDHDRRPNRRGDRGRHRR